jgi:hypothetical protein
VDLEEPATIAIVVDDGLVAVILLVRSLYARPECLVGRFIHLDFLLVNGVLDLLVDEDLQDYISRSIAYPHMLHEIQLALGLLMLNDQWLLDVNRMA